MKLQLWQVDAFASKPFEGNPAAIVPLESFLDAGAMQKIANENNLAETAFIVRTAPGKYDLRWFTPESEVDLCGHATLASAWLIFEQLDPELKSVAFETRSGTLTVERGRDGKHTMSLPVDPIAAFDIARARNPRFPESLTTMKARAIITAFIVVAVPMAAIAADQVNAQELVVNGFYTAHQKSSQDGVPDAKQRAKYEPYVSPELNKLLVDADAAEARYAKANPDSPPMMEGDLFSPNFEGITSFKVGTCAESGNIAQCKVVLRYAEARPRPQDKPVEWTDTVTLVKTASGWRVDDIAYGGTWDFGNHGALKAILNDMIANGPK